jgi:hypothetical protein
VPDPDSSEVADAIKPDKFEHLSKIFKEETGLSFEEYFHLTVAIWSSSQKTATFRKDNLISAQIPSIQYVLTDEKVESYLKILSADYNAFRSEDKKLNALLAPEFTKFRLNPLLVYPIIKSDKTVGDPYIIPNTLAFAKKAFGGLYWWFHLYFEKHKQWHDFRDYYGKLFEQYVGQVLKQMYGQANVHPEITYDNKKFIDWWIERDSKIYLFEAKAYQFALLTKQTGGLELLIKEVKSKIVGAIIQVYRRLQEIDKYSQLSYFKGKQLIPIIVFMDIPFSSGSLYKEIIDEELSFLEEKEPALKGIKNTKIYFLNVEELEFYGGAINKIPIEEVFARYENDMRNGFLSVIAKEVGGPIRNKYLDAVYKDFWKKNVGVDYQDF